MVVRRGNCERVTADLTLVACAAGYTDHKSAMVPATKGAATLVPPEMSDPPTAPRPVILSPGARRPRLPMVLPRFDRPTGRPWRSQAATGMTQGWRVIAELPIAP